MSLADQTNLAEWLGLEDRKPTAVERAEYFANKIARKAADLGSNKRAVADVAEETGRNERDLYRDIRLAGALQAYPLEFQRRLRAGEIKGGKANIIKCASLPPKIRARILDEAVRTGSLSTALNSSKLSLYENAASTKRTIREFTELPNPRSIPHLKLEALKAALVLKRKIGYIYEERNDKEEYDSIYAALLLIESKVKKL